MHLRQNDSAWANNGFRGCVDDWSINTRRGHVVKLKRFLFQLEIKFPSIVLQYERSAHNLMRACRFILTSETIQPIVLKELNTLTCRDVVRRIM